MCLQPSQFAPRRGNAATTTSLLLHFRNCFTSDTRGVNANAVGSTVLFSINENVLTCVLRAPTMLRQKTHRFMFCVVRIIIKALAQKQLSI